VATYGLTPQGWLTKPTSQIQLEIDVGMKKILGDSAGTEPDGSIPLSGMAGQLKTLIVDPISAQWELLEILAASIDPQQANDTAQDNVCAISGVQRHPAEFSTSTVACTGVPGTPLPVTRVLTTTDPSATRFDSVAALLATDPNYPSSTIAAATAWHTATVYVLGQRVTANGNIYQCSLAGTSAGGGSGPAGTSLSVDIIDNTAHWRFLGAGTGVVDVGFVAEVAGPLGAAGFGLTTIATPISGWLGAANPSAAIAGVLQETNAALRVRRDAEVAGSGNGTVDAIKAHLLAVNQNSTDPNHLAPTSVKVLFNDEDFTDPVTGLPPHSVECIVQGGTPADIAQAIWDSVDAGTKTYGVNQVSPVVDSEGNAQTVSWTRPIPKPIYVAGTVFYDPSKWPSVGAAPLVAAYAASALLTYGSSYPVGQSVRSSRLSAEIIDGPAAIDGTGAALSPAPAGSAKTPGLLDVAPLNIGTNPAPVTATPIPVGIREIATFDINNIAFTCTPEAP
jgi:hypothetical protein